MRTGAGHRRVVDLPETVQLVPHDVQQQARAGRHLLHEVDGVGLVELEHRDIGVQASARVDLGQQGRGDAAHEVRAGGVGEDLQPLGAQQVDEDLGGRGLPVGPGDHDHAERERFESTGEEAGVDPLDHESGEGAATASASAQAGEVPSRTTGGDGEG
jgi:hypothetical protein